MVPRNSSSSGSTTVAVVAIVVPVATTVVSFLAVRFWPNFSERPNGGDVCLN